MLPRGGAGRYVNEAPLRLADRRGLMRLAYGAGTGVTSLFFVEGGGRSDITLGQNFKKQLVKEGLSLLWLTWLHVV